MLGVLTAPPRRAGVGGMRQLTITIPRDIRSEADGELQVLVEDWTDEGFDVVTASARPAPGAIWRPVTLRKEPA